MFVRLFLYFCATVSIATTVGIVVVLLRESMLFFLNPEVRFIDFIFGTDWQPLNKAFGVLPLVVSTILTSVIALIFAVPPAIMVALYLSEYASKKQRRLLKPILELLAGIPTIVYGYFAINMITPALQASFGSDTVELYNTASAGITIGILIFPIITTMVDDAFQAVPNNLREAAYGLGATRHEAALTVVLPAAFSGIAAAFILALSRAIGETMIVALAAGAGSRLTLNPFKGAETMTGYIVRISGGDISYNTPDYNSIFAIGFLLFIATLVLNIVSRWVVTRFKETYE